MAEGAAAEDDLMVWTAVPTIKKRAIEKNGINRLHRSLTPAQPVCAD